VVKWLDAKYSSGKRGLGWLKIKPQSTADAIIMGFKPGTPGSSFDGKVGAIIFGQHDDDGNLVERGRCSGMDWSLRCAMSADEEAYIGRVVEVAHFGVQKPNKENPHGALLSPQFKRFRDDEKTAAEVTIHDVH
jgi:ATP-dependent DNA ligase